MEPLPLLLLREWVACLPWVNGFSCPRSRDIVAKMRKHPLFLVDEANNVCRLSPSARVTRITKRRIVVSDRYVAPIDALREIDVPWIIAMIPPSSALVLDLPFLVARIARTPIPYGVDLRGKYLVLDFDNAEVRIDVVSGERSYLVKQLIFVDSVSVRVLVGYRDPSELSRRYNEALREARRLVALGARLGNVLDAMVRLDDLDHALRRSGTAVRIKVGEVVLRIEFGRSKIVVSRSKPSLRRLRRIAEEMRRTGLKLRIGRRSVSVSLPPNVGSAEIERIARILADADACR